MAPPSNVKLSPMARWVAVLSAFTERDAWGVRDLAEATGLPRSATHRILHEMERQGLLAQGDVPGTFRIGPRMARLSVLLAERVDVVRVARPILAETMAETGETVILALYDLARRQFWAVAAAESPEPIRYIWESLRTWSDLHVGSSGKGILAFLPDDERDAILAALPDPVPGLRPMSKADLRAQLAEARTRGYVVSHGERFSGAVGASAPIRDARGRVIGDVIVSWPDNRTNPAREADLAAAAVRAADRISGELGFR